MPTQTVFGAIAEKTTFRYEADLVKEDGTALTLGDVNSMKLTISNKETGAIVNACDEVNILNADRGALDASGRLVVTSQINDAAILDASQDREVRLLTFELLFAGNQKAVNHVVEFPVINLNKV